MAQSPGHKYNKVLRPKVVGSAWTLCEYTDNARRWALVQNQSDEAITVGFGSDTAAPAHGMLLGKPSATDVHSTGGRYEMSLAMGNLTAQAIWAKCASGNKTLLCAMSSDDLPAEPAVGLSSSSTSLSSASSASSDNSSETASSVSASSASTRSASSASTRSASSLSQSSRSASSVSTSSWSSVSASSVSASSRSASMSSPSASSASSGP